MSSLRRISAPTALRAADLVRREGEQISAEDTDLAGNAAGRLHGIDMQQAARRMDDRGRLRDRLHHAGLVVGKHERDERPYRAGDGSRERGQVDPPFGIDGNFPDHLPREAAAGADRGMLDCGDKEDFARPLLAGGLDSRRQGEHVRLGAAGGEEHVGRARRDQRRHLLPRGFDQTPRRAPLGMHRGRVAGDRQRIHKGPARLRPQRRRGVPIEINALGHGRCLVRASPQAHPGVTVAAGSTRQAHPREACFLSPALC